MELSLVAVWKEPSVLGVVPNGKRQCQSLLENHQ